MSEIPREATPDEIKAALKAYDAVAGDAPSFVMVPVIVAERARPDAAGSSPDKPEGEAQYGRSSMLPSGGLHLTTEEIKLLTGLIPAGRSHRARSYRALDAKLRAELERRNG